MNKLYYNQLLTQKLHKAAQPFLSSGKWKSSFTAKICGNNEFFINHIIIMVDCYNCSIYLEYVNQVWILVKAVCFYSGGIHGLMVSWRGNGIGNSSSNSE